MAARVLQSVDGLERFLVSGRVPPELPGSVYRELVVSPCRVFYRESALQVFIIHVMREEKTLRAFVLEQL